MSELVKLVKHSYLNYANYLWRDVTTISWHSYFYYLILISLVVWIAEIVWPWRSEQKRIREDFWLDGFYMFFNFFLFSLISYNALSDLGVAAFEAGRKAIGLQGKLIDLKSQPFWLQMLCLFVMMDFIQWNVHRMMHRVPLFWEFHKVHHSVREMGFAAHLRFHWMETVLYKSFQYVPLAFVGFGLDDFFIVHAFAILVGHLNHANLGWGYGIFGYLFNSPKMHIWHHARTIPGNERHGVNYGLTLSVWDFLFGTANIPGDGRDEVLGFADDQKFPRSFVGQVIHPLTFNKYHIK
jgi:sterol desaturase/sphingolipid hydroxylase (fatty acid hydroxylase superfamily)